MKIKLTSTTDELTYVGTNENEKSIKLSSEGAGVSPMESVLMAVAGCSAIDIEMILNKMRQSFSKIEVEVEGKRREEIPRIFTDIHLLYHVYGDVKSEKMKQAVDLSMEKYCSVSIMLKEKVDITYGFVIHDDPEVSVG